jgi:hypothetical protein
MNEASRTFRVNELDIVVPSGQPDQPRALIRIGAPVRVIGTLVGTPFVVPVGARYNLVIFVRVRFQNSLRSADQATGGNANQTRKKADKYLFIDVSFNAVRPCVLLATPSDPSRAQNVMRTPAKPPTGAAGL